MVPLVHNTDAWVHFQHYETSRNLVEVWENLQKTYNGDIINSNQMALVCEILKTIQ